MNNLYLRKITANQANGNQIDIPKTIATSFFEVSQDVIDGTKNQAINVCHRSDLTKFEQIEIQGATNIRFSTKLNSFLALKGDVLEGDDLLVVEKLGRSFSIWLIKKEETDYSVLTKLFDEGEKHLLLTASIESNDITEGYKSNLDYCKEFTPYLAALRTKPFMLLAGISGTGKSRIAREIAKACWPTGSEQREKQVPDNFCMVQVKPNWHDSTELLGYVSRIGGEKYVTGDLLPFIAKAWENPSIPYILCLDEMNLAPVEQYFAEYLSVIESRRVANEGKITTDPIIKKDKSDWFRVLTAELTNNDNLRAKFLEEGISIPQNLFVVGTVNMDETTFSFSRKVLDRAMTIEMNEVNLRSSLSEKPEGDLGFISNILLSNAAKGTDVYISNQALCDSVVGYLEKVNNILEGTPFKIAYRTRNEFMLYAVSREVIEKDSPLWKSLDEMTSMKILSRIEGDDERCKAVLNGLFNLLNDEFADNVEESVSIKKVNEMLDKLKKTGYTSYWT